VKIAALQMTSGMDVAANLATATRLLESAAAQGAVLAVLPENFAFMGRDEATKRAIAEAPGSGPAQDAIAALASRHGMHVVAGTLPLRVPGEDRVAAASLVFGPDGRQLARYDKIHLFDVDLPGRDERYRESAGTVPGREVVVVDIAGIPVGMSVCYDMRFPELYRRMAARGARGFVVPAAFTVPTGEAHWDVLLRSRAVENLAFVAAAAQWGEHENGRCTYGHSLVIDCWGAVQGRLPAGEGLVVVDIDIAAQDDMRARFPALSHRVLD
jgi:nitrilase